MANKERIEVRVMSPGGPLWLQHRKNPDVRGGPIVGGTVGACSDNGTSKPHQQIHRERCSKHGGIGTLTVASQNKPLLSPLEPLGGRPAQDEGFGVVGQRDRRRHPRTPCRAVSPGKSSTFRGPPMA